MAATALLAAGILALLLGGQWMLFWREYASRLQAANLAHVDLLVEQSERRLYGRLESLVNRLGKRSAQSGWDRAIAAAWSRFEAGFGLVRHDAAMALRADLALELASIDSDGKLMAELDAAVDELLAAYSDPYRELQKEFARPPLRFFPAALLGTRWSGYVDTLQLNRALYLARIGELGTARVLVRGLEAAQEPRLLGLVHYLLGRLDLEVLHSRPEAELRISAARHLRRSLQADPQARLPRQVLTYLLSTAPQWTRLEVHDETASDARPGEGAAITPDLRRF